MNFPVDIPLGRAVVYPTTYNPSLLCPIARATTRGQQSDDLLPPFRGHDRWQAYELGWLDVRGKPQVATATLVVPYDSTYLIESKSLKLYLNSLNAKTFPDAQALQHCIAHDLSSCAHADVAVYLGVPDTTPTNTFHSIDTLPITITDYGPPHPDHLHTQKHHILEEHLASALFKSNCPVTGQPDWADLHILYRGPAIDHAGLLRYIISYRNHADFHEHCVERIFLDIQRTCAPEWLIVEACYTRRGGIDINPIRYSPNTPVVPSPFRPTRQ